MRTLVYRWRPAALDWGMAGLALFCVALIVGLPPAPAAGLLLAGAILIGTLIDPVVGLCLTVASVMIQELVPLPLGLTVTHVVGAIALGSWLLHGLARREVRIERPLLLPWALFLAALLLSAGLTAYNAVDALKQVVRWILAFLAFVIAVSSMTTPGRALALIGVFLAVGMLESLIGLGQFIAGEGPFGIGDDGVVRAYGTIGKPNTFAGFLGMSWPLGVALGLGCCWQWWLRRRAAGGGLLWLAAGLTSGLAALIMLAGVAASFSRGAWLGAAAALAVMLALVGGRRALPLMAAAGLLGALALARPQVLPGVLTERVASITDNLRIFDAGKVTVNDDNFAVVERMAHWQAGAGMFLANPLIGVGPDNFNKAYPDFFVGRWSESQGHAHNYYIHIAAEAGLIGLVCYLVLIGAVARAAWRALAATRGTPWFMVAVGGCGIIAAVQVHNVFENLHVLNFGIHLSAVWGLLTVLAQRQGWRA